MAAFLHRALNDVNLQILAFNDYHGHLEGGFSPGQINGALAGGGEYLSAKLSELRSGNPNSLTMAAGDLDPVGVYNVTVNSFLADGGDNFDTLGTITTLRRGGGNDLDALIDYFTANSPIAPPSTDRVNELP